MEQKNVLFIRLLLPTVVLQEDSQVSKKDNQKITDNSIIEKQNTSDTKNKKDSKKKRCTG